MWNIADVPMVVSKWSPLEEEAEVEVKSIPMWVTLKNVPRKMFSWDGLGFLTSPRGDPKRLHPDTETCKGFDEAKVFVEVDLTKELPKSFRFKSDKGVDAIVEYVYPRLPHRCEICSKWGHLKKDCVANKGKIREETEREKEGEDTEGSKKEERQICVVVTQVEAQNNHVDKEKRSQNASKVEEIQNKNDVANVISRIEREEKIEAHKEESWQKVSATKIGRQKEKMNDEEVNIVSPSNFSILSSAEDEHDTEQEGNQEV